MSLLDQLRTSIDSMSRVEKLLASLQVTVIGISIVFVALLILYGIITIMTLVLQKTNAKQVVKKPVEPVVQKEEVVEEETIDDGELVAVITAAIAASLHTSTHNIIVRNIVRAGDSTPTWGRVGRANQVR